MDLSKVKANFLQLERKGWFLPGAPQHKLKFPHDGISPKGYREAAVLFLINKQLQVLLSKRSSHVSNFEGHACLPGGSQDKIDVSFVQTALREAQEEVNLDHSDIEVVCTLPPTCIIHHTLTIVTPVVALTTTDTDQLNLVPEPAEVEYLYWVPLEFFLTNTNEATHMLFNYLDSGTGMKHVIFGFTAFLCVTLSGMALGRFPDISMYRPTMLCQIKEDNETDFIILVTGIVMITTEVAMSKL